ncbi:MAG: family 16 glycoside hydrolase, partial [Planctomycetia bacterium]
RGNPPNITSYINGTKVTEFAGDKKVDVLGDEGSIAVQVHGGGNWPSGAQTRFRNIRIKKL